MGRCHQLTLPARPCACVVSFTGDLLRINFNFSFPHLQCQYASVDVSDVLGMVRPALQLFPSFGSAPPVLTVRTPAPGPVQPDKDSAQAAYRRIWRHPRQLVP